MGISCGGFDMRRYRKILVVAVVFFGLAVGCVLEFRRCEKALGRYFRISQRDELLAKYEADVLRCESRSIDGETYMFVWMKPVHSILLLPSGGPLIIFNNKGEKVDACADSGDCGRRFRRRWLSCGK